MQGRTRSVEYNYELLVHQIVHNPGEVYRLSHQIRTPGIYIICHPPVQRMFMTHVNSLQC